jgi:hypothetical protein
MADRILRDAGAGTLEDLLRELSNRSGEAVARELFHLSDGAITISYQTASRWVADALAALKR